MFFFFPMAFGMTNWVLVIAAVLPAAVLMVKVYKSDHIEKESPRLLFSLLTGGILATILACVERSGNGKQTVSLICGADPHAAAWRL